MNRAQFESRKRSRRAELKFFVWMMAPAILIAFPVDYFQHSRLTVLWYSLTFLAIGLSAFAICEVRDLIQAKVIED